MYLLSACVYWSPVGVFQVYCTYFTFVVKPFSTFFFLNGVKYLLLFSHLLIFCFIYFIFIYCECLLSVLCLVYNLFTLCLTNILVYIIYCLHFVISFHLLSLSFQIQRDRLYIRQSLHNLSRFNGKM